MMMASPFPNTFSAGAAYPVQPLIMPQPPVHPSLFTQPSQARVVPQPTQPVLTQAVSGDVYRPTPTPATPLPEGVAAAYANNGDKNIKAKKEAKPSHDEKHTKEPAKKQKRFLTFFKSPMGIGASLAMVGGGAALLWHHSNNTPEKVMKRTVEALTAEGVEASKLTELTDAFGIALNRMLSQPKQHDANTMKAISAHITNVHAKHSNSADLHNGLLTAFINPEPSMANINALDKYSHLEADAQKAIQHAATQWIDTTAASSEALGIEQAPQLIAATQLKLNHHVKDSATYTAPLEKLGTLWNNLPVETVSHDEAKGVFELASPELRAEWLKDEKSNIHLLNKHSADPAHAKKQGTEALYTPIDASNHLFNLHATAEHGETEASRVAAAEAYNVLVKKIQAEGLIGETFGGYKTPFTRITPIKATPLKTEATPE
jgi:hypothetical protein